MISFDFFFAAASQNGSFALNFCLGDSAGYAIMVTCYSLRSHYAYT